MSNPERKKVICQSIEASDGTMFFTGPPLDEGPLPAFLYFSISGEESLTLDPFNQPVAFLQDLPIRCFSITLPYHGDGYDKSKAMQLWGTEIEKGNDILTPFLDQAEKLINDLIENGVIDTKKFAVGGLSRGAFIACHLAARISSISSILGYAPLTSLNALNDFTTSPLLDKYSLSHQLHELCKKKIRFYIGNLDVRVGTDHCFHFVHALSQHAQDEKIRSPEIELFIGPSIGHKGHGTSPKVFYDGVKWISNQFQINLNPLHSDE